MRRHLLAALAACALAAALPTGAMADHNDDDQIYRRGDSPQGSYPDDGRYDRGRRGGRWGRGGCDNGAYGEIQGELQRLYHRVRRGQYDGSYSRDSARNFYRAIGLDQQYLDYYYRDGCLDRREVNDLHYRIDALREQMVHYDRRRDRRGGRW